MSGPSNRISFENKSAVYREGEVEVGPTNYVRCYCPKDVRWLRLLYFAVFLYASLRGHLSFHYFFVGLGGQENVRYTPCT